MNWDSMFSALYAVRLKNEIENLKRNPLQGVACYPKDDDITRLEAYMKGPSDTPYSEGVFKLDVRLPDNYPVDPPEIRFVTRIYHPNIDKDGRICALSLQKGDQGGWCSSYDLKRALITVLRLLAKPDPDGPLEADIAKEYEADKATFNRKALEFTLKFAKEGHVMPDNKDQEGREKAELEREDIEDSEDKEKTVEAKPRPSFSLSRKKSNAGSLKTSGQQSSKSTQSNLASASSLNQKRIQSTRGKESTALSPVRKPTVASRLHDSTAPSTLPNTFTDKMKSPKRSAAQIKVPKATKKADIDDEAFVDAPKGRVNKQQQAGRATSKEIPQKNAIMSKAEAKDNKTKRKGSDIHVLSDDDENGESIVHSL